jgi:hypothetical protein
MLLVDNSWSINPNMLINMFVASRHGNQKNLKQNKQITLKHHLPTLILTVVNNERFGPRLLLAVFQRPTE